MKRIGFLINPIAGMGGRVGLKGTDGVVDAARALGALPNARARADEALCALDGMLTSAPRIPSPRWLTCAGAMGEDALLDAGFPASEIDIAYTPAAEPSAADTKSAVRAFVATRVDLICFCGGDGTARDICAIVGLQTPLLGVPAGVKMYSGVFGTNPEHTAGILMGFLEDRLPTIQVDVLDLDEAQYRADEWRVRLYYSALTPFEPTFTQSAKAVIEAVDDEEVKEDIAETLHDEIELDESVLVLLGPGSTVKSIADSWGIDKTLLGIDAVVDGGLVGKDLNEKAILELLRGYARRRLVLSPIGAQGFVLGRGNLQLSPEVIRAIGIENLVIVATPAKLARTPMLRFDTGDRALDEMLVHDGYVRVLTGYRRRRVVRTAA